MQSLVTTHHKFQLQKQERKSDFQFQNDSSSVFGFKNGEIYIESECVGCLDDGILAMALSPDLELFVIVSGKDSAAKSVVLMTKDFEPVSEVSVLDDNQENDFVNVGWGKKETQFHGQVGKTAAKQPLNVCLLSLSIDFWTLFR